MKDRNIANLFAPEKPDNNTLAKLVDLAQAGDKSALDSVIAATWPEIYRLALRFTGNATDAEDATQEVMVRIITRLSSFRGESQYTTWAYRVATNHLLNLKQSRQSQVLSFEKFGADLTYGLEAHPDENQSLEYDLLLNEVRVGCTLAMLQCLDSEMRLAYIFGEILEVEHHEASMALELAKATYRKRLSRAREKIANFMLGNCGLVDASNACRCSKRVRCAIEKQRIDPNKLIYSSAQQRLKDFPQLLSQIRELDTMQRSSALYRIQQDSPISDHFINWLKTLVSKNRLQLDK